MGIKNQGLKQKSSFLHYFAGPACRCSGDWQKATRRRGTRCKLCHNHQTWRAVASLNPEDVLKWLYYGSRSTILTREQQFRPTFTCCLWPFAMQDLLRLERGGSGFSAHNDVEAKAGPKTERVMSCQVKLVAALPVLHNDPERIW